MSEIGLTLLKAGFCLQPEFVMMRGGRWQAVSIPALFALLAHPKMGTILFDTGYTARFKSETDRFPYSLYPKITPMVLAEGETARQQLERRGIAASDVRYVIVSHFHADHIAGLADFPQATYIYFKPAYEAVRRRKGFAALRAGFLPRLLPPDFEQRSRPIDPQEITSLPPEYSPFSQGVDLFEDGALLAVPLPGHAHGQMGLILPNTNLGPIFLAADSCWRSQAYRELIWPHPISHLVTADVKAYRQTLAQLHRLHQRRPQLQIIPSHCQEALAKFTFQEANL